MLSRRQALRRTLAWPAARRSLIVAAVVGTALNLINQGPELLIGHWPVIWKVVLTYTVPFLVASYGSYAAYRSSGTAQPRPGAAARPDEGTGGRPLELD